MTSTAKLLVAAADMPNASTALYTSPANGKGTWIDKATATSHNAAAQTVTFNNVPAAGAVANGNLVVNAKSIATNSTDQLPELVGKFIPPGGSLYGICSAATAIALEINGRELS
jgi:hypothetical protein